MSFLKKVKIIDFKNINKIYMLKEPGGACVYKKWILFEDIKSRQIQKTV